MAKSLDPHLGGGALGLGPDLNLSHSGHPVCPGGIGCVLWGLVPVRTRTQV